MLSGEPIRSALFVPLVVGGRATGVISLQNADPTRAFTDADERLLTTLAGGLAVALDNARLVHETRQRVAELATVNSVGQALASQLDLGPLIELVGEQVRKTFHADIAYVALRDEGAGRIDFAYHYQTGDVTAPPLRFRQRPHVSDPRVAWSRSCSTGRSSATGTRWWERLPSPTSASRSSSERTRSA